MTLLIGSPAASHIQLLIYSMKPLLCNSPSASPLLHCFPGHLHRTAGTSKCWTWTAAPRSQTAPAWASASFAPSSSIWISLPVCPSATTPSRLSGSTHKINPLHTCFSTPLNPCYFCFESRIIVMNSLTFSDHYSSTPCMMIIFRCMILLTHYHMST